jgi:lauroyl/myristoyl acyltransferase
VVRHPLAALDGCGAYVLAGGGEAERAAALWRAVRYLKDGGLVLIAADGLAGDRTRPVEFLGRRILLARGPFVLARLSGAPLIPIVASWTSDRQIRVEQGSALDVGVPPSNGEAFEAAAARATASWMERRVLQSPRELRPHTIRWLQTAPRA